MKWSNKKETQALLKFIIDQKKDLSEYKVFYKLIPEHYLVMKKGKGVNFFFEELINDIIDWEKGNQDSSLEQLILNKYLIYKRI